MAYIYEIRNLINNKVYIGSTKNFDRRCAEHLYELSHNVHKNKHLQRAWNKYGKNNFMFTIIEEVENTTQFDKEQKYIDEIKLLKKSLYNICIDVYNPTKRNKELKHCDLCNVEFESEYKQQKYCSYCSEKKQNEYVQKMAENVEHEQFISLMNDIVASEINYCLDIEDGECIFDEDLCLSGYKEESPLWCDLIEDLCLDEYCSSNRHECSENKYVKYRKAGGEL